jgi:hypothetical protein
MVNETKVKIMTKAAMAQKKERRNAFVSTRFFGDDYVSLHVIKGVVGVTIIYLLVIALWVLLLAESLMTQYRISSLLLIAKGFGVLYLLLVILTVLISILIYTAKYWKAKDRMKGYRSNLKKLYRMYQGEEKERENK